MENTSTYLKKEVASVDHKIEEAKGLVLKELGVDLFKEDDGLMGRADNLMIEREIREVEEEDDDDDENDH